MIKFRLFIKNKGGFKIAAPKHKREQNGPKKDDIEEQKRRFKSMCIKMRGRGADPTSSVKKNFPGGEHIKLDRNKKCLWEKCEKKGVYIGTGFIETESGKKAITYCPCCRSMYVIDNEQENINNLT